MKYNNKIPIYSMDWPDDIIEEKEEELENQEPTKEIPDKKDTKKDTDEKQDPYEAGVDTIDEIPEGDTENYGIQPQKINKKSNTKNENQIINI